MNLRNCPKCGRMFNFVEAPAICDACKRKLEEDFQRVKQYIEENPTASMKQISEDNQVSNKIIQQWIREERLMFSKDSPIQLLCEKCGEPIVTGRYCVNCKEKMANNLTDSIARPRQLQPATNKKEQKSGSGMRFMEN